MRNRNNILLFWFLLFILLMAGCAAKKSIVTEPVVSAPPSLTMIHQIDSFKPEAACRQAIEVINNNPYEQEFFEKIFARIIEQCQNSRSPANADLIWDHLVVSLKKSGKVPPDLVKTMWNYYFSKQFISLPDMAPVPHYCYRLAEIKRNLEKEYHFKKAGFEVCQQGRPDAHFLNAMYVYNTMWAACHETD